VSLSFKRPHYGIVALSVVLLGVTFAVLAQTNPVDHGAHHPGSDPPTVPAPSPPFPSGGTGMGGVMGAPPPSPPGAGVQAGGGCGPMGCMGGLGPRPFYSALMAMPTLTPEARQFIEDEAGKRLGSGSWAITTGQEQLHQSLLANDTAAMQRAIATVRSGVLEAESGAGALQAINEGQSPRQLALTWFKTQMNVPAAIGMAVDEGPWGLSWYHLTIMTFLVAFLLATILIHYARLRRIGGLVQRLTPGAAPAAVPMRGAKSAPFAADSTAFVAAPTLAPPSSPAALAVSVQKTSAGEATDPGKTSKPWTGALRVADIFYETPNVKTFRLRELAGGSIPFTFVPGQFLTFAAELDGKRIRRSYTIASAPTQRDYVELTVKREDQGAESRYLHDNVAIGDHLEVSGPAGVFTFTGTEANSIVLISGGVGITPMMCITRYLTDRAFPGDIFFLYGASSPQNVIFREELEYLRKRHANLHVATTVDHADETPWTGAVGHISKEFIAQNVPEIARRRVHVCGPPAMMEAVKSALAELGVPKHKTKSEAFGQALGAVPAPAAAGAPTSDTAAPATSAVSPSAAPSAQAEVQFSKSGKTGPLAPDKCVLEAAEAIGVAIDFSCRVGTCGICAVPLLKGAVTMEVEEGLPPADKARGIILACQAKSVANLVVDA
jgi:ferredoxin-NADP reductase